MTGPPKTLEYSTILRSRKRVVMIVVLVFTAAALGYVGSLWLPRVRHWFSVHQAIVRAQHDFQIKIIELRSGNVPIWADSLGNKYPDWKATGPHGGTHNSSVAWKQLNEIVGRPLNNNAFFKLPPTNICLAELDAGSGTRFVGVDLWFYPDVQPGPITAVITTMKPGGWFSNLELIDQKVLPVAAYQRSFTLTPGTRDPNHPDRATFKVIADGVEKTFVVILRKDDTITFEEQP